MMETVLTTLVNRGPNVSVSQIILLLLICQVVPPEPILHDVV